MVFMTLDDGYDCEGLLGVHNDYDDEEEDDYMVKKDFGVCTMIKVMMTRLDQPPGDDCEGLVGAHNGNDAVDGDVEQDGQN